MGVDACIFAKNAKKYIDIDRYYNLSYDLPDNFRDHLIGISSKELLDILFNTIEKALTEKENSRFDNGDYINWWKDIILFLLKYPNDIYFIKTDHDEPCSYSFMKETSYDYDYDKDILKEYYKAFEKENNL